jgi:hypothetical protein
MNESKQDSAFDILVSWARKRGIIKKKPEDEKRGKP